MFVKEAAGAPRLPSRSDIDTLAGRPAELNEGLTPLVSAAGSGNLLAVETLLYAIVSQRLAEPGIRRVLVNPHEVEEVTQDVLIVVAEQVGHFRGDSRFTTWLGGIGQNKALEFVRRKRPTSELPAELGDSARISSLITTRFSVQELLARLPDSYRIPVSMRDIEGMTYDEIATALDLNLNTVKTHIARGRAMLASCVVAGN